MENLNADKVKRVVECCANNDECIGEACPYYTTGCEKNMPKDALALITSQEQRIKELTEENERLRADVAKEFTCVFGTPHKVSECPIGDEIAKAKADTVRKMQAEIEARCIKGGIYPAFVASTIDQIAKEMLEGEK